MDREANRILLNSKDFDLRFVNGLVMVNRRNALKPIGASFTPDEFVNFINYWCRIQEKGNYIEH